jgi:ribosomal-protein-alanine N-acetyltransferase
VTGTLRAATAQDAPSLARLHATSFPQPWSASEIEALLTDAGGFGMVAARKGKVSGFILGRSAGGEAEILTLAVAPEARRAGLGLALVETAALLAHAGGATALFLEVATDNPGALALYDAARFARAGVRPGYYRREGGPPIDALVLRRDLTG